jgi:hypothetical protein
MISSFQIFFISHWWYGQFFFKFQTEIFISNFKNVNFQIFSFRIFVTYFNFFISLWRYGQISIQISKSILFFNCFHFPLVVWPNFFKRQKQIFSIKIPKTYFCKKNHFKFFLWYKRFFSQPEVAKFIKILWKLLIYPYQKNSHILHTTSWWYGPP